MTFLVKLVLAILLMVTVGFSFMYIDQPITEYLLQAAGVQDVFRTEAPVGFIIATFSVVCGCWVVFIASIKRKFVSACMMRSHFARIRDSAISLYHFFDLEFRSHVGFVTLFITALWATGRATGMDYVVFVTFIGLLAKSFTLFIMVGGACLAMSLLFYEGRKKKPKKAFYRQSTPEVVGDLFKKKKDREVIR